MIFSATSLLCTALKIITHIVALIRRRYENETNKPAEKEKDKHVAICTQISAILPTRPEMFTQCPAVSINAMILFDRQRAEIAAPLVPRYILSIENRYEKH